MEIGKKIRVQYIKSHNGLYIIQFSKNKWQLHITLTFNLRGLVHCQLGHVLKPI